MGQRSHHGVPHQRLNMKSFLSEGQLNHSYLPRNWALAEYHNATWIGTVRSNLWWRPFCPPGTVICLAECQVCNLQRETLSAKPLQKAQTNTVAYTTLTTKVFCYLWCNKMKVCFSLASVPCALSIKLRGVQCLSPSWVITCITNLSHLSHVKGGRTSHPTYVSTNVMTHTLSRLTIRSHFTLLM